ncbi:hypothetical protein AYL99_05183 [Fonsecaea erecta]|uniref:Uncharacterized protein n=1 Tax=Fonsecaea erecta TaxID=1367422 RepID=A0A178ZL22_9EURO|nr:hypothetical protein AYL99_05183 [Fonsecaea erecta]OAP60181.1 hypothetical protein AYL99_05183 [Fonsecaea erecta]
MASPEPSISVAGCLDAIHHWLTSFEQTIENRPLAYLEHLEDLTELLVMLLGRPRETRVSHEEVEIVDMVSRVRHVLELAVNGDLGASQESQVASDDLTVAEYIRASMQRQVGVEIEASLAALVRLIIAWVRQSLWQNEACCTCDLHGRRHVLESHLLLFITAWVDLQRSINRDESEAAFAPALDLPGPGALHPVLESMQPVHDAAASTSPSPVALQLDEQATEKLPTAAADPAIDLSVTPESTPGVHLAPSLVTSADRSPGSPTGQDGR